MDKLCKRVYNAFVSEWWSLIRAGRWYIGQLRAGVKAPWGYNRYSWRTLGKKTCEECPEEFRVNGVGNHSFRKLIGKRCPAYLGALLRLHYAELLTLMATAGVA